MAILDFIQGEGPDGFLLTLLGPSILVTATVGSWSLGNSRVTGSVLLERMGQGGVAITMDNRNPSLFTVCVCVCVCVCMCV